MCMQQIMPLLQSNNGVLPHSLRSEQYVLSMLLPSGHAIASTAEPCPGWKLAYSPFLSEQNTLVIGSE